MSDATTVQARLAALGLYTGKIDGVIGPASLRAILAAFDRLGSPLPASPSDPILAAQPRAVRSINEIIVHCTATRRGQEFSVADIRAWHIARGWSDIGYHYVVHLDGRVEMGRPEARAGAHVEGHNSGTIGVVYVGGVEADGKTPADTRTPEQRASLEAVCRALRARYPTITRITGHNQYAAKACPSFDVRTDPLAAIANEKV